MPNVRPNEKQSDYISRCVPVVMKENGNNQKAALGKCYGMYKEAKKRKRAKGSMEEPKWEENENKISTIIPPVL